MKTVRPYVFKESRDAFLPRDVLDELDQPPHIQQGNIVVFATSAAGAGRILESLQMTGHLTALTVARRFCVGEGRKVLGLGSHPAGTVLAYANHGGNESVVKIEGPGPGKQGKRIITRIGSFRRNNGYHSRFADQNETEPKVTGAMLDAAWEVLPRNAKWGDLDINDLRNAIIAALRAQKSES